jgi:segregation and condensation protein B
MMKTVETGLTKSYNGHNSMTTDAKIEALLFFKGEPVSISKLAELLGETEDEIRNGIYLLQEKLEYRGLTLVENDGAVMLGTHPEASALIEKIKKDELSRDLGKAGVETLAIVLYKGPVSRQEIDYIRGVNSSFILRNLMVRGLVDRVTNPDDSRSFLYKPTFELLSFLGISTTEELPEFGVLRHSIEQLITEEGGEEDHEAR